MASYKFIGGDGKPYGPFPLEKLRQFVAENRLNAESQVQKDGGAFAPASTFPELMGSHAPAATPVPTPTPAPAAPAGYPPSAPTSKPGKVQAIELMTLIGGIIATLSAVAQAFLTACFYFTFIYGLVFGIMAIVKGAQMLGKNPWPAYLGVKTIAIMGIINIINCDPVNLVVGILILVFLGDPQVRAYMRLPAR